MASTPDGTKWLSSFLSQCQNCTIDFLSAHFYGPPSALQQYLLSLHTTYPAHPIWLTEFGFPQLSADDTVSLLNETIAFLDGLTWVKRYGYFGGFRKGDGNGFLGQGGAVWDEEGEITAVGRVWLGLEGTPRTASEASMKNGVGVWGMGVIASLVWVLVDGGMVWLC